MTQLVDLEPTSAEFRRDAVDICRRLLREIVRHGVVLDGHDFAKHVVRRIVHADIVVRGLAHLLYAIQTNQDRHNKNDL